ncbi:MAG: molecular chaperone TorD family protein [Betaproteobacteria bacterium]|jgi:TorA maturation chaperone TorD|nr:molecular chaperone TorD family protein [Betaproteobacteria bacterium]MDH4292808.1 molecular chaperone TorD family protein [Betaproteobacteria bacterium]MDH5343616.1 molecular chaperone TorD family protein [Betaproteobacteria bacterium]
MMMATTENVIGAAPVAAAAENDARAALYAVLAHLFISSPSAELLRHIVDSRKLLADDASPLVQEWNKLRAAAEVAQVDAVRGEFDEVFVGTGRPPVSLYASSYMSGRQRGQLLAELRDDLGHIGYARAEGSEEYEDHLSALCDVMRGLVIDEMATADGFERQKVFFRDYLAPWYGRAAETICKCERTDFYRIVAGFANAFLTNETEYFELA